MASHYLCSLSLGFLILVSGALAAPPRKPVDVPFGRNYMPTWAFDHIKYYNGGSEIQLSLDNYTGKDCSFSHRSCFSFLCFELIEQEHQEKKIKKIRK